MIPRYTHPEMGRIWSEKRKYDTWLQVELAASDALAEAGLVRVRAVLPSYAVLFKEAGLVAGLGEARRTVAEGGAYVNNVRVTDADAPVSPDALLHGKYLVLRRGKRTVAGAEFTKS